MAVLYTPGNEPEELKKKVERILARLNAAYPDKVVISLSTQHKHLGEDLVKVYKALGYTDNKSFLEVYGFTVEKKEREKKDYGSVIDALKAKYASGAVFSSAGDLIADNPEYAAQLTTLNGLSKSMFGMTFKKYLIHEGLLISRDAVVEGNEQKLLETGESEFVKLKERYYAKPFEGDTGDLEAVNPDINWKAVKAYCKALDPSATKALDVLSAHGIVVGLTESRGDAVRECVELLRTRYPEDKQFRGTMQELKEANADIDFDYLAGICKKYTGETLRDRLIREKIILTDEDYFDRVMQKLVEERTAKPGARGAIYAAATEQTGFSYQKLNRISNERHGVDADLYYILNCINGEGGKGYTDKDKKKAYDSIYLPLVRKFDMDACYYGYPFTDDGYLDFVIADRWEDYLADLMLICEHAAKMGFHYDDKRSAEELFDDACAIIKREKRFTWCGIVAMCAALAFITLYGTVRYLSVEYYHDKWEYRGDYSMAYRRGLYTDKNGKIRAGSFRHTPRDM